MINGTTNIVGLIGNPVEHSFSPLIHNAAFDYLNLNYVYVPFNVKKQELHNAIVGANNLNIKGLNVTIPYKTKVLNEINRFDIMANLIGAVNTIKFQDGKSEGYNTDGIGALKAIEEVTSVKNKKILIIGAGGVSRAISFQLAISGIDELTILNRSAKKAKSLVYDIKTLLSDDLNDDSYIDFSEIDLNFKYGELDITRNKLENIDILINTTPVGMYPNNNDKSLVKSEMMHPDLIVNDLVYNPIETSLIKEAKIANAKTISGIKMLLYQGAESFKIWTGKTPPINIMENALFKQINKNNKAIKLN